MTKSKLLRLFKELKHEGAVITLYDLYKARLADLEALVEDKYVHTDERTIAVKDLFMDDIIRMFEKAEHVNSNIIIEDYDQPEVAATYRDLYDTIVSEKKYKFTFLASEYLCDVMRFIRMSDVIKITDKYGRVYLCDTFLMTPKWETQGNLASVEVEFQTNTVAKRIGRNFTT